MGLNQIGENAMNTLFPTTNKTLLVMSLLTFFSTGVTTAETPQQITSVKSLGAYQDQSFAKAQDWASRNGYPTEHNPKDNGEKGLLGSWFLIGMADGYPVYYETHNVNAGISTGADANWVKAPAGATGAGLSIGVWDSGLVHSNHQELVGRVINLDGSTAQAHSSHVGGTIGASGVDPLAKGMAPSVTILSANLISDMTEIPQYAAQTETEALENIRKMTISNHSYGATCGWMANVSLSGNLGHHWIHSIDTQIDPQFGQYNTLARDWDALCQAYPYWLPFMSAGNDRDDTAPLPGAKFYYVDPIEYMWVSATYDPAIHPMADFGKEGFDTLIGGSAGKNVMTIGAVDDAVKNGVRDISMAKMSAFSGWGPTDDGRIKPDVVANGVTIYSIRSNATNTYTVGSGTSMSSPNAAGSALLLQDLYRRENSKTMPASMLKGLIIHTTCDIGRPGPDYENGWGLMNAERAGEVILRNNEPKTPSMITGKLDEFISEEYYTFYFNGTEPLKVTLCWTDPAGVAKSGLDDRTPALVHDLDLRVFSEESGETYLPFVLDPENPAEVATTGDNVVDTVEQVLINQVPEGGLVTIVVSHKNALEYEEQAYSLIITGSTTDSSVEDWEALN
jgi:subtilisin family serine protease